MCLHLFQIVACSFKAKNQFAVHALLELLVMVPGSIFTGTSNPEFSLRIMSLLKNLTECIGVRMQETCVWENFAWETPNVGEIERVSNAILAPLVTEPHNMGHVSLAPRVA